MIKEMTEYYNAIDTWINRSSSVAASPATSSTYSDRVNVTKDPEKAGCRDIWPDENRKKIGTDKSDKDGHGCASLVTSNGAHVTPTPPSPSPSLHLLSPSQ